MKLYMHPVSTTSRPVRLFAAEEGIQLDEETVDLMTGAHHQEPYITVNPNRMVPVLEDGDLRLTESAAILRYLAEKTGSPAYPDAPHGRARVNEMLDWFNSNLYRDFGYGLVYPQVFPHHRRASAEAQAATLAWGKAQSERWLGILDTHWLAHGKPQLSSDGLTIADHFGACLLTAGDLVGCDFSGYPRVAGWLDRMRALPSWGPVNAVLDGFAGQLKGQSFERIAPA